MLGVSSRLLLALQLFSVGAQAVGMRTCVTHGNAGSTGISSFFLAF